MKPYFQQDNTTLYHGDSREIASLLSGVTALVSDPPYGMKDKSERGSRRSGRALLYSAANLAAKDWQRIKGDDEPFDPSIWLRYQKVVLFGAVHFSSSLPVSRAWIVWDKREGGTSDDNADCDFAWTNLPGPARLYSQLWRGVVRRGRENGSSLQHPHQKPINLMKWVLKQCKLTESDLILDPYCGSGTTLLAAKELGIPAVGIDVDEGYLEVARERLSQGVMAFA
jgi:site-specific DNA-methyltransferase (adenine-specific)